MAQQPLAGEREAASRCGHMAAAAAAPVIDPPRSSPNLLFIPTMCRCVVGRESLEAAPNCA